MSTGDNSFATVLNCMDGRVQLSVNEAVRKLFDVAYVDTITEAGIVKFVSDDVNATETEATLTSIRISLDKHGSRNIAVVAHYGCAGNVCSDQKQKEQLVRAVEYLQEQFGGCKVVGMWVNSDWAVEIVC